MHVDSIFCTLWLAFQIRDTKLLPDSYAAFLELKQIVYLNKKSATDVSEMLFDCTINSFIEFFFKINMCQK